MLSCMHAVFAHIDAVLWLTHRLSVAPHSLLVHCPLHLLCVNFAASAGTLLSMKMPSPSASQDPLIAGGESKAERHASHAEYRHAAVALTRSWSSASAPVVSSSTSRAPPQQASRPPKALDERQPLHMSNKALSHRPGSAG